MTPISFPECNTIYKPPHGWDEDKHGTCDGLPVLRTDDTCTSRWMLTKDELGALNMGGCIELTVVGGQPAVKLEVV